MLPLIVGTKKKYIYIEIQWMPYKESLRILANKDEKN